VLLNLPWVLVAVVEVTVEYLRNIEIPYVSERLRRTRRGGYRSLRLDDDAALLGDPESDDEH
jgi:hypothetical protein